jgi:hypothetical protein
LQSWPDVEEIEVRLEFSGNGLKVHAEEMVFGQSRFETEGTASPPVLTPTPAPTSRPASEVSMPRDGERVMLPLHIVARLGEPGQQVIAALRWEDGTKLTNHFKLLKGDHGEGLLIASLDWVNMLQPPEPETQVASLQILDSEGKPLVQRSVKVVSPNDPNTRQIKLFWTVSGNDEIVQPQTRKILEPAPGQANVTGRLASAVLEELLWGPPVASQVGFGTALPAPEQVLAYPGRQPGWGPRVTLRGVTIENGVATADFSKEMQAYGGGSLRVKLIREQITQTLKQFPEVREVSIAVEGRTEGVLEP